MIMMMRENTELTPGNGVLKSPWKAAASKLPVNCKGLCFNDRDVVVR